MKSTSDQEPLLPPWAKRWAIALGPLVVLVLVWYLLGQVAGVPAVVLWPTVGVIGLAALIVLGGRLYKPFYVNKQGRCTASGAAQRQGCRHYIPGARLGGGCGRLTERGICRYVR